MRNLGPIAFACASVLAGCLAPPPPSQRVADVAREMNLAARFGRMDVALEHTAEGARKHFSERRADWGGEVRVLDFEFSGLSMPDSENATLLLDIQWVRLDENMLHLTRVEQSWRGGAKDKGWVLVRERRIGGDLGLFGEKIARLEPEVRREDAQFPTKTIR
jgi:hypothetical protein